MKAFHSKMMLSDVLQEREIQLNLKQRKASMEHQIEKMWEDTENEHVERLDSKLKTKYVNEYIMK